MEPLETPPQVAPEECAAAAELARRVEANVRRAVEVDPRTLEHLVVALVAEGHVLLEDAPGGGKTTLARALAKSVDLEFARVRPSSDTTYWRSAAEACTRIVASWAPSSAEASATGSRSSTRSPCSCAASMSASPAALG